MDEERSNVYTEYELLNILLDSSDIEINLSLEVQLTAMLKVIELGDNIKYCDPEYVKELYASVEWGVFNEKMKNWISNMAGSMASNGIVGFTNGLRKVVEQTNTLIEGLENDRKKKTLSDKFINERFYKFNMLIERAKAYPECFVKGAAEYEKMMSRFEGLQNMCERVNDMAESSSDDEFMSDKIWDTFSSMSNTVCRAADPKPGSTFRNFEWLTPYTKSFDFKKSKWNNKTSIEECKQAIRKLRDDAFDKLVNASKHIKTICGDARSEVQHVRNDNYQDMAREYARTYVITKFVQSLQALILKEINMFVTLGIRKLGSFDIKKKEKDYSVKVEEEPEDNSEVKKDDGEEKPKEENEGEK
ncbi:MAG: hypothetical protein IKA36_04190 [Clostridia bacterium]|nr:hypothetical protein [Clostridia bacterium]